MPLYWIYIATFPLAAGVAITATPLVKAVALKFKKLDAPCARKIHHQPMVRLGGVAIFGATVCALSAIWFAGLFNHFSPATLQEIASLLLCGSGFFAIGFADDLFNLLPLTRLCLQMLVASLLWLLGIQISVLTLPGLAAPISLGLLSLPITVLWVAGVVNAINWIDGLDGLATGVSGIATAVLIGLGLTMSQPVPVLAGSALLGSLVGFLYYNYNPAKIFMGDGGSYFIGCMLASLCMVGPQQISSPFSTLLPLMILAVPLADMTKVIATRLYRKQSPFTADNLHLHHCLLNLNLSQKAAVWVMYLLTLATSTLAFVMTGLMSGSVLWAAMWSICWTVPTAALCFLIWQLRSMDAASDVSNIIVDEGLWYSENLSLEKFEYLNASVGQKLSMTRRLLNRSQ